MESKIKQTLQEKIDKIFNSRVSKKCVLTMDYYVVDEIISNYFNVNYEICAEEELNNDSVFEASVFEININSHYLNDISAIKNGKIKQWMTNIYLSYMAKEKIIPEGNYLISISW